MLALLATANLSISSIILFNDTVLIAFKSWNDFSQALEVFFHSSKAILVFSCSAPVSTARESFGAFSFMKFCISSISLSISALTSGLSVTDNCNSSFAKSEVASVTLLEIEAWSSKRFLSTSAILSSISAYLSAIDWKFLKSSNAAFLIVSLNLF